MGNWERLGWQHQYGNVRVAFQNLPSLSELRDQLGIKPLNTGRRLFTKYGGVTDDLERLYAVSDKQGRARFISGTEFSMYQVYRGQTQNHPTCLPKLGRLKTPEEQLLALCRNVAFEDVIADHPFVRLAEKSIFLGHPLFVDKEGMAQHYDLPTHMLDVTGNFDVASFFATCAWNKERRLYEPVIDTKHHGVIYRLTTPHLVDPVVPESDLGQFNILGWQPLPRPEQQRAFLLRMKPGQDLSGMPSIERFQFRHRARVSIRIWKAFDEGRALFPTDTAAELAAQAETLQRFTRSQIDRAWERLEKWTAIVFLVEKRSVIESGCNISEAEVSMLSWAGLDVETDESRLSEKLQEVFNRVRYRLVAPHFCDSA